MKRTRGKRGGWGGGHLLPIELGDPGFRPVFPPDACPAGRPPQAAAAAAALHPAEAADIRCAAASRPPPCQKDLKMAVHAYILAAFSRKSRGGVSTEEFLERERDR
jgi:hypothetical protein